MFDLAIILTIFITLKMQIYMRVQSSLPLLSLPEIRIKNIGLYYGHIYQRKMGNNEGLSKHLMIFSLPWLLSSLGNLSTGKVRPRDEIL